MEIAGSGHVVTGEKSAVEQADLADRLAVTATRAGESVLAFVDSDHPDLALVASVSFDATLPMYGARFSAASLRPDALLTDAGAEDALERLGTAGALLAAAEATGAAERILDDACRYAAERRQFGRSIASFQALRHILADMYLRAASGSSTVLLTPRPHSTRAPAMPARPPRSRRRTSRAVRARSLMARCRCSEASRSPMSIPRTGSCGGSWCASSSSATPRTMSARSTRLAERHEREPVAGVQGDPCHEHAAHPTAQRLEHITTGAEPAVVGRCSPRSCTTSAGALHVALISGGKSNLTYRVASDAGELILRRPPLGHVLPTAHDMVREYRVRPPLEPTDVPVPRTLHLGNADGPLGASFYVMERVVGHICRNELPSAYADAPAQRAAIGRALIETLARLHAVDPREVGLAEFGRPAGFMERQLRRWSEQWQRSKVSDLPALDALRDELARTLPPKRRQRSFTATTGSTTRSFIRRAPVRSSPFSIGR